MRRTVAVILLCSLLLLVGAAPAIAQARDPFRPPAGAGPSQGDTAGPPAVGDGDVAPPEPGRLPRTGQDLMSLVAVACAFLAAGGSLRLTGKLLTT